MKIYYIGFVRIPTEKAHGLTIVKSCEAFASAGATVELIIPRRKTQFEKDIFETYGVKKIFTVRYIPTLDLLRFTNSRVAFWISYVLFYLSTFFTLLFASKKDAVIYTREAPFLTLSLLGAPAFLESHHVFARQKVYFRLVRLAKGIVTISHALKEKFIQVGFDKNKILVQPSGVELATFLIDTPQEVARQELELPLDKKIIAYTGNFTTMEADKGISDILHALQKLPDVLFVAVGGSEKDIALYENKAKEANVSERVLLRGFAPQTTLALYQRAADILLMPFPDTPHYSQNMSPVKMFEYMASGRPIIASDLPTIREVLNKGNAVLVPPGNAQALAGALRTLLADPAQGEVLAREARKEVGAYRWEARAERMLAFIEAWRSTRP
jgi:glycosyltransferase involved in cell wall biosynthesis